MRHTSIGTSWTNQEGLGLTGESKGKKKTRTNKIKTGSRYREQTVSCLTGGGLEVSEKGEGIMKYKLVVTK